MSVEALAAAVRAGSDRSTFEEAKHRLAHQDIINPRECPHAQTSIRYKMDGLGRKIFKRQCLSCGAAATPSLKHQEVERCCGMLERVDPWDDALDLSGQYEKALREEMQSVEQERREEWFSWYNEYLQSPQWREKRALVFRRAGNTCEGCRLAPATQVHHLTYVHVGAEFLWELVAICDDCHSRLHPHMAAARSFGEVDFDLVYAEEDDGVQRIENGRPGPDCPF